MRTAEECEKQAAALEALARDEPNDYRRLGYKAMADWWREMAASRRNIAPLDGE